jgi:hypothetical protein
MVQPSYLLTSWDHYRYLHWKKLVPLLSTPTQCLVPRIVFRSLHSTPRLRGVLVGTPKNQPSTVPLVE